MPAPSIKSGRVFRRVNQFSLDENSAQTYDLPRGFDLNALMIKVSGTIALTTAAAVKSYAPMHVIDRIDVFADGNKQFDQRQNFFAAVALPDHKIFSGLDLVAPGSAVTTHTVRAAYLLDRVNADGPRPKDSALHTRLPFMSLLQTRIQMSNAAACFNTSGTAGGTVTENLTTEIFLDETSEFVAADNFEPRFVKRVSLQKLNITGANTALKVNLPIGSYFRRVNIWALDGSAAVPETPSSALINSVKIYTGLDIRYDMTWTNGRIENAKDYHTSVQSLPTGYLAADLCPNGDLNTLFNLTNVSEAFVEFDVNAPTNTGQIWMQVEEFFWQDRPQGAPTA